MDDLWSGMGPAGVACKGNGEGPTEHQRPLQKTFTLPDASYANTCPHHMSGALHSPSLHTRNSYFQGF